MIFRNKVIILFTILCLPFFFLSSLAANGPEKDYKIIIDLVYEWSPQGSMIQIGDYTISDMGSIMLDNGSGSLVPVGRGRIQTGELVKVRLIDKDKNGFWQAYQIIVLTGEALASAKQSLPRAKQKELTINQLEKDNDMLEQREQGTVKPYLDKDGVWKY